MKDLKFSGTALNEAAVQIMTSKVMGCEDDIVTYYNVSFPTISPDYYPLECNLVSQMAYIAGEYSLFESALLSTEFFKNKYISLTSSKAYYEIVKNLDNLMELQEKLIKLTNESNFANTTNSFILSNKIEICKKNITNSYIKTQNLILCSYFDKAFASINTFEELENYRRKLYNYKQFIGITDGYNFFNNYYIDKMNLLERKYDYLEKYGENVLPIISKTKKSLTLFSKIKAMFYAIKE